MPILPRRAQLLGLTEADASRLKAEAAEKKRLEEEEAAAELEEERKRLRMEAAVKKAAELNADTSTRLNTQDSSGGPEEDDEPPAMGDDEDEPAEVGASGTHEFECNDCGYIIFPAAGREFKFFGDDFKCPQCGSGKDSFVDNGPA